MDKKSESINDDHFGNSDEGHAPRFAKMTSAASLDSNTSRLLVATDSLTAGMKARSERSITSNWASIAEEASPNKDEHEALEHQYHHRKVMREPHVKAGAKPRLELTQEKRIMATALEKKSKGGRRRSSDAGQDIRRSSGDSTFSIGGLSLSSQDSLFESRVMSHGSKIIGRPAVRSSGDTSVSATVSLPQTSRSAADLPSKRYVMHTVLSGWSCLFRQYSLVS